MTPRVIFRWLHLLGKGDDFIYDSSRVIKRAGFSILREIFVELVNECLEILITEWLDNGVDELRNSSQRWDLSSQELERLNRSTSRHSSHSSDSGEEALWRSRTLVEEGQRDEVFFIKFIAANVFCLAQLLEHLEDRLQDLALVLLSSSEGVVLSSGLLFEVSWGCFKCSLVHIAFHISSVTGGETVRLLVVGWIWGLREFCFQEFGYHRGQFLDEGGAKTIQRDCFGGTAATFARRLRLTLNQGTDFSSIIALRLIIRDNRLKFGVELRIFSLQDQIHQGKMVVVLM